jgi:excisionase family DNA binding protein
MDESLQLLDRPAAAALLGVSVETIRKMIESGSLEAVRLHPTAHPRVRRSDIEGLVRGQRPAAGP